MLISWSPGSAQIPWHAKRRRVVGGGSYVAALRVEVGDAAPAGADQHADVVERLQSNAAGSPVDTRISVAELREDVSPSVIIHATQGEVDDAAPAGADQHAGVVEGGRAVKSGGTTCSVD